MKYAIVIPDGSADEPQESLGGKTPLQAANIPAMDAVARAGVVGRANFVPRSLAPCSSVAREILRMPKWLFTRSPPSTPTYTPLPTIPKTPIQFGLATMGAFIVPPTLALPGLI